MTTSELMEHAMLDVLALLDEEEQSAFDRAFRSASPEVQAQVRREQTRLARIDALLPDVEPPVTLRARVLAAVRAAMSASSSPAEAAAIHIAQNARSVEHRSLGHRRRVTPWWRAAALGATAAAVVLGTLLVQMHSDYQRLENDLKRDALLSQLVETFGSRYVTDAIFDADTRRVAFRPDAPGSQGRAAVWYHPDWDSARFFVVDLPVSAPDSTYRLVVLDDQGNVVQDVAQFDFRGGLLHRDIPIQVAVSGSRLGVMATVPGETAGRIMLTSEFRIPPA
ncbi:MAG: hypothetical protein KIS87_07770 [Phycisphaeraceae bacterium]|nr:hypothetical protein [Phycisphaeraceae bacterium]